MGVFRGLPGLTAWGFHGCIGTLRGFTFKNIDKQYLWQAHIYKNCVKKSVPKVSCWDMWAVEGWKEPKGHYIPSETKALLVDTCPRRNNTGTGCSNSPASDIQPSLGALWAPWWRISVTMCVHPVGVKLPAETHSWPNPEERQGNVSTGRWHKAWRNFLPKWLEHFIEMWSGAPVLAVSWDSDSVGETWILLHVDQGSPPQPRGCRLRKRAG